MLILLGSLVRMAGLCQTDNGGSREASSRGMSMNKSTTVCGGWVGGMRGPAFGKWRCGRAAGSPREKRAESWSGVQALWASLRSPGVILDDGALNTPPRRETLASCFGAVNG